MLFLDVHLCAKVINLIKYRVNEYKFGNNKRTVKIIKYIATKKI